MVLFRTSKYSKRDITVSFIFRRIKKLHAVFLNYRNRHTKNQLRISESMEFDKKDISSVWSGSRTPIVSKVYRYLQSCGMED